MFQSFYHRFSLFFPRRGLITFYFSYLLTLLFFFRLFFHFEKNQYVYIVRSVNGKDFQLFFPAQFSFRLFLSSLCVLCGYRKN